jgi:hypothetical protein
MTSVSYPWYILPSGDWYLRSIIINASGIERVKIYTSTEYDGNPDEPVEIKTFSTPFNGKRINFDLQVPFVKIRVVFEGDNLNVFDVYYNTVEKRIV